LGWYPLREAISDHLAAWRHLNCDPEQVIITSGAAESLDLIFRGLLPPAATVAVEDPCWPKTRETLSNSGNHVIPLRIDSEGFNTAQLPPDVTAAIVTPSRHYPTGLSLPLPRRVALCDWAARIGGTVIEDDYDSEFRYRGQPLPSLSGLDGLQHTIYLGSFSKLISSALRIGYLVLPKHLLGKARTYMGHAGARASLIPQPALATFMQSGEFSVHLRRMRRIYAQRQHHLIDALAPVVDLLDVRPDPSGMHLCVPLKPKLSSRVTDQEISKAAQNIGLHTGALSAHSILPEKPQGLLLGYAAFDEDTLTKAACRLVTLLREMT
jgi:GntR family transcriptional regulator/MocR family aminotransferase